MKHHARVIPVVLLLAMLVSLFVGCSKDDGKTVRLSYGTGIDGTNYNKDLYAYNQGNTHGADPGVIYVSEEENAEYGGYYYAYVTGGSHNHVGWNNDSSPSMPYISEVVNGETVFEKAKSLEAQCYRSKDLSYWELAGALPLGFSLAFRERDWEAYDSETIWAPEVIYNAQEELYYMFYTIPAKLRAEGSVSSSSRLYDRHYIGIATSSTPVGPFLPVEHTETLSDNSTQYTPCINFREAYDLDFDTPVIDVNPFIDEDGTLYLYFKGEGAYWQSKLSIFGMKMINWTTPDYDSLTLVAAPSVKTVSCGKGKDAVLATNVQLGERFNDSALLEAPFMMKHNGKYYLTYSANGYTDQGYSVWQAISDSPLGIYEKVSTDVGNPVLSGSQLQHVKGTGHHSIVQKGDEMYIVYHAHCNTVSASSGVVRVLMSDRISFVNVNGTEVLVANGPSKSLQWLPESVSGYKNLAQSAKVEVSKGVSGAEYLTDGILPYYTYNENQVLSTDQDITITLKFDEAVSVRSIMIYNSATINSAFSKIASIKFKLAENPAYWMHTDYEYAVIENLAFPGEYLKDSDTMYIVSCAPAVAEFDEIKVTEITITINANDRLLAYDKLGNSNTILNLSEIVVLGR